MVCQFKGRSVHSRFQTHVVTGIVVVLVAAVVVVVNVLRLISYEDMILLGRILHDWRADWWDWKSVLAGLTSVEILSNIKIKRTCTTTSL